MKAMYLCLARAPYASKLKMQVFPLLESSAEDSGKRGSSWLIIKSTRHAAAAFPDPLTSDIVTHYWCQTNCNCWRHSFGTRCAESGMHRHTLAKFDGAQLAQNH